MVPPAKDAKIFMGLWIGLTVLVGVGIFALLYAVLGRTSPGPALSPVVSPATSTPGNAVLAPTQVRLPTVTAQQRSTNTAMPTNVSASTPTVQATTAPTSTAVTPLITPTRVVTGMSSILTSTAASNIRNGPGVAYTVIGGLELGDTAEVVGRDTSGTWFVIRYAKGTDQHGWVASRVVSYAGEVAQLPVVAAPPLPPTAIPPTAAPTPKPVIGGKGITGQLTLCQAKTVYGVGERVCFVEKIVNTTNSFIAYGVLGVLAVNTSGGAHQFQTSWSGELGISAGCTGPTDRCGGVWEDGIRLNAPGQYTLYMQICYSPLGTCLGGGEWESLTSGIALTIN